MAQVEPEPLRILMMGPITDAYQADAPDLVKKLDRLRSTELVTHLQNKHHAYMAVSMLHASELRDLLAQRAQTEPGS